MVEGAAGLSARIAEHVATTPFAALPASTVLATKRALLDGIGVILSASGMSPEVTPFVELARGQAKENGATILGHGLKVAPGAAALANGAMSHALDYEDAFDLAPVHPNASLIPAALAVAEAHGPITGEEFIAAMAIGCDLVCRLGLSLRRPMEESGWYPPPILGAFGATAAAARLMRLSPRQVTDAFSLLLCQVSCPGEIKYSADTVIRAVREAFPAQAAVTSVELALQGIPGFAQPLEGKAGFFRLYVDGQYDPSALLIGLGEHFWIERLSFKPWPACRGTHAYIEAARKLAAGHGFSWREIDEIRLEGGEIQQMLVEPEERKKRPATSIDAKFSLPFTVAVALVRGDVGLDDFSPSALADPDLSSVASKVTYSRRLKWGRAHATCGAMEILLADGRRVTAEILEPLGSPDRPLSDAQLKAKFVACAARSASLLPSARAEEVAERILALEAEPDMARLVADLHV